MEMHQVRYFLAVADTLNFTRAAEQCHVSQPALTRAIQQLEEELGGLLLRREHKLTHLTDFGRLIEPHLRQLFADAEAARSTARRFSAFGRRWDQIVADRLNTTHDSAAEPSIACRCIQSGSLTG